MPIKAGADKPLMAISLGAASANLGLSGIVFVKKTAGGCSNHPDPPGFLNIFVLSLFGDGSNVPLIMAGLMINPAFRSK